MCMDSVTLRPKHNGNSCQLRQGLPCWISGSEGCVRGDLCKFRYAKTEQHPCGPLLVVENPKKPKLLGKKLHLRSKVPWNHAPPAGTLPARSSGRWKHPSGFEGRCVRKKMDQNNPRILESWIKMRICKKITFPWNFKINFTPYGSTSSPDSVEHADVL